MFVELEDLEEKLEKLVYESKKEKIMNYKFDVKKFAKLDSPERRRLLPPEEVIKKMELLDGQKVVDIGCGIGYFTFPMAKAVGKKGFVYGVDISEEMLNEAKIRYSNSEVITLNNIKFIQSKESILPLDDHIADVVLMVNVFHELDEPNSLLTEIKRVLINNGKLLIVEWKKEEMEMGPPLSHRKSVDEINNTIIGNGFNYLEVLELPPAHLLFEAYNN